MFCFLFFCFRGGATLDLRTAKAKAARMSGRCFNLPFFCYPHFSVEPTKCKATNASGLPFVSGEELLLNWLIVTLLLARARERWRDQ